MTPDLVERAERGDHEAFDVLATAAYHRLYAIARRILRDGCAAEDAVQDALVKAWREVRGLRDPGAYDAWLHRLLVNACRDHARRTRRRLIELPALPIDGWRRLHRRGGWHERPPASDGPVHWRRGLEWSPLRQPVTPVALGGAADRGRPTPPPAGRTMPSVR